ncbi:hypothetical protein, partial [Marinobacter oulmenensis]|uniref:hypothetical protein n=1 Tax=Marinobacter oulmenensis TaxID=643747 RepID=UPI00360F3BD2
GEHGVSTVCEKTSNLVFIVLLLAKMAHEKQVIEEVSGWLTVFEDGSVDRTLTGPPEDKFMAEPVPPHDDFIDGVAVKDVVADENTGSRLRIYLPERNDNSVNKLPIQHPTLANSSRRPRRA